MIQRAPNNDGERGCAEGTYVSQSTLPAIQEMNGVRNFLSRLSNVLGKVVLSMDIQDGEMPHICAVIRYHLSNNFAHIQTGSSGISWESIVRGGLNEALMQLGIVRACKQVRMGGWMLMHQNMPAFDWPEGVNVEYLGAEYNVGISDGTHSRELDAAFFHPQLKACIAFDACSSQSGLEQKKSRDTGLPLHEAVAAILQLDHVSACYVRMVSNERKLREEERTLKEGFHTNQLLCRPKNICVQKIAAQSTSLDFPPQLNVDQVGKMIIADVRKYFLRWQAVPCKPR